MADSVTINGYTYTLSPSNKVLVNGPGFPSWGGMLDPVSSLSAQSFIALASSPNLSPAAQAAMTEMATSGQWEQVKEALATPPPAPPPAPPPETEQPNTAETVPPATANAEPTTELTGTADDDGSNDRAEAARLSSYSAPTPGTASGSVSVGASTTAGASDSKPGKRLKNPLGWYSSYTYQISLYIMSPEARDKFVNSGRQDISGAKLILQSGGITDATQRAPGFAEDFYIDNLKIKTVMGKATQSAAVSTEISFQITEPYGFSLISRLKKAVETVKPNISGTSGGKNPTRQFFVLGIRFIGYGDDGKILTGKEIFAGESIQLDPRVTPQSGGTFELYYDLLINSLKFKIDGKATTYQIKAAPVPSIVAFNVKRGRVDNGAKVTAGTVGEAIREMLKKMTAAQQDLKNAGSIKEINNYTVEFIGPDVKLIENASLVLPDDTEKSKTPSSRATNSKESTDAIAIEAVPNTNKRELTFKNDTAVLQAIDQIIVQSSFLRDALKVSYKSTTSPDPQKKDYPATPPDPNQTVSWYSVSPRATNPRWDPNTSDYAYDITYVIQKYETPILPAAYASKVPPYPGPHKRYEYWYTGKNSEVIGYEQQLDNTFFNVTLNPAIGDNPEGYAETPNLPNKFTDQNRQGRQPRTLESQNNIRTILYDPGAFSKAKITILGDPDLLMNEADPGAGAKYDRYYGPDGYTVNPNGSQVLIEIDFKEPYDYDSEGTGLMTIEEQITFIPNSSELGIKGVSYMVIGVESTFNNGKFTQVLDCVLSTFSSQAIKKIGEDRAKQNSGPNSNGGTGTTSSNGLAPVQPVTASAVTDETTIPTETDQRDP